MSEERYTGPAKCQAAPCASCPYRKDVPSGVWARNEYEKLPAYDGGTLEQFLNEAVAMFNCHQQDGYLCAGWVAVHDMTQSAAIRMTREEIDPMIFDYVSPVPVFASGQEAHDHGVRDIENPSDEAYRVVDRLERKAARREGY